MNQINNKFKVLNANYFQIIQKMRNKLMNKMKIFSQIINNLLSKMRIIKKKSLYKILEKIIL